MKFTFDRFIKNLTFRILIYNSIKHLCKTQKIHFMQNKYCLKGPNISKVCKGMYYYKCKNSLVHLSFTKNVCSFGYTKRNFPWRQMKHDVNTISDNLKIKTFQNYRVSRTFLLRIYKYMLLLLLFINILEYNKIMKFNLNCLNEIANVFKHCILLNKDVSQLFKVYKIVR